MLCVSTTLGQSAIHGIGIFAREPILAGQTVWQFSPGFDLKIPVDHTSRLPNHSFDALAHYCYVNPNARNVMVICLDDARFMNFLEDANTELCEERIDGEQSLIASRDIAAGEELTVPFCSDADAARKIGGSSV